MNIICALLLLFLPEEQAFYLLCTIIEQITPDYYVKAMIGTIVDQRLFEDLIFQRLPNIMNHLNKIGLPLALISLPWFLCLFIGYVSLEVSLRILDCFFYEGSNILFSFGIAMFRLNESTILNEKEGTVIVSKMKETIYDTYQLLNIAFEEYKNIPKIKISEMRNTQRFKAIKEMEKRSTVVRNKELEKITHFTLNELNELFKKFYSISSHNSLNFPQFQRLFNDCIPWWEFDIEIVYKDLLKKNKGVVDFTNFIYILSIISKGTPQELLQYCFDLYDTDNDKLIGKEEFEKILNTFKKYYYFEFFF